MIELKKELTVSQIADFLGGELVGDGSIIIEDVADIANPAPACITFAIDSKYLERAESTEISAVIVPTGIKKSTKTIIKTQNPRLAFARIISLFYSKDKIEPIIHNTVVYGRNVSFGKNVAVMPHVSIGNDVKIGDNTVIYPNTAIYSNVSIGNNCVVNANVVIYDHTNIGDRVIIHSGSVIGSDGFGYVLDVSTGELLKIPQIGNVVIEDDVEIGSNVSIDRAALGTTIIKKDVKIDNLVQIGHNCIVGEHTTISGQSGLAGSVELGKYITVAGQVGFADHIKVEDKVIIAAKAGVSKSLKSGKIYWGVPAKDIAKVKEEKIMLGRLPKYIQRIRELENKLQRLEEKLEGKSNDK